MSGIRAAAVAGSFYPADAGVLEADIRGYLEAIAPGATASLADGRLKALVVPHAGYIYSGPVAASAYAALRALSRRISRVVLLGPAHTVYLTRGSRRPEHGPFRARWDR